MTVELIQTYRAVNLDLTPKDRFDSMYQMLQPMVGPWCERRVRTNGMDSLELQQDIWLKVWLKFPELVLNGDTPEAQWKHLSRWFWVVAGNFVRDRYAKAIKYRLVSLDGHLTITDQKRLGEITVNPISPEAMVIREETLQERLVLAEKAQAMLFQLTPRYRMVLVLHAKGLNHNEVARLTGGTPGAARKTISRANKVLIKLLEKEINDWHKA